jgi:hypothetical protein
VSDTDRPPGGPRPRRAGRVPWGALALVLASLPQLAGFSRIALTGRYTGSAYEPRVEAFIGASQTGAQGGPFATVPLGRRRYSTAPVLISDLGMAGIADSYGRVTGHALNRRVLAWIVLGFLAAAVLALAWVMPVPARWALVPVALLVPLCVREYRSPDVVAIHGALALLAVVAGTAAGRLPSARVAVTIGILLFALHTLRAPYGLYAAAAWVGASGLLLLREWSRRRLAHVGLAFAVLVVLEAPWALLLRSRAEDPRVVDGSSRTSHGVFQPLISGIGWSDNPWGIVPWDLKVAAFMAARDGRGPVDIASAEAEKRARDIYLGLWREAPGSLLGLYLRRIPWALGRYFLFGGWGALLWLGVLGRAGVLAWRKADLVGLAALAGPALVSGGLLAQIVLVDTRLLYAYPLHITSAVALASSVAVAVSARRGPSATGRSGSADEDRKGDLCPPTSEIDTA